MNSLISGCLIVHSEGRVLYVNEALARRLQCSPQQVACQPPLPEIWPGVKKTQMFRALQQCLQDRKSSRMNTPLNFPDGRQDWFFLTFTPVPDGLCILFVEIAESKRIEEALRESKERFETVVEQITDTLSVIDLDGNILFANHHAAKNLGGGLPEDVVGKNIGDFVTPSEKARELIARYRSTYTTQTPFSEEVQVTLQNRTFWFYNRLIPFEYGTEKIPSVLSTSLDITERKQVEEALWKNQIMLARTEKIANVGSWEWDIAPDHVRWSDELFRLFGRDPAAGAPSFAEHANLYVPEDMQRLQQAVQRCVADGTPYELELRAVRPDGTIRYCVGRGKAERDQDGVIRHLAGSMQDITDRKQAEERLRENYDLLNITQQLTKVGGWEWDIVNQKMSWTDETFRIHGLTPDEFEAGSSEPIQRSIACYDPEFRPVIEAAFQHCVEAGELYELECLITAVGGQHKWISTTGQPVIKDGKIVKVIGNIADITERKQMEDLQAFLAQTASSTADQPFFKVLARYLAQSLNMDFARIDRLEGDGLTARTVATWRDGHFKENGTYALRDTPCGDMAGKTMCCFPADVRQHFPHDQGLLDLQAQSYIGTTLLSHTGKVIGLIVVIGRKPMTNRLLVEASLRMVSVRAAGELERLDVEEALRGSEQKWRNILVNTPQVGIALDPEARIVFANAYFLELTGWKEEEILGQNWFDLFIPEKVREEVRTIFDKVMHSQETAGYSTGENEIVTRNGDLRNVVWSNVLTKNAAGYVVDVTCLGVDVTERKRAENLIRTHEHYLDTILQTAGDGFLVLDPKGKVVQVNDTYCRMSGYTRDEILGMSVAELDLDEGSVGFAARVKDIISKGSGLFESRHCRKDGSLFSVEISVTWLKENGGQFISFCRDLTERKRAEEERQRLQEQLFQSQKMESVGRLAGGVAHDFNNMLGAILGHAELAMMKLGEDNLIRDDLKEIVFAASRSADITRQLLAFARKQIVLPKVLDLNQRVEEMLKMIRRLIGEDIDLLWLPGRNLWPLKMDPSQINQILVNLCVNARDAIAGAGKITIETGMVTFDAGYCDQHAEFVPGDFLLLAVSDNGRGMDRKTLNKLFEPFFTTKELGKGTGLGLATVYGIVKQNQGVINVYSEPGRGTTFNIYLPSHKEPMVEAKSEQQAYLERGCETILLVEDELVILKMTTMMLESLGYTVLATDNPSHACDLARAHDGRIHLLITDVIMPLMNGRELAQQVLSLCPDIKCLFMSGYTANVIARHGVLQDGVQFLAKPFSMNDIALKVRQVLDEK